MFRFGLLCFACGVALLRVGGEKNEKKKEKEKEKEKTRKNLEDDGQKTQRRVAY